MALLGIAARSILQTNLPDGYLYRDGWLSTQYMPTGGVDLNNQVASADESLFAQPEFRSQLRNLPPSAKLVAKVLDINGSLDHTQIAEETLLPDRTIRYALTQLEDADLVTAQVTLQDARKHVYKLQRPA